MQTAASETRSDNRGPVRRVTEADAQRLADFFRQTWDPGATAETVLLGLTQSRQDNLVAPGEVVPAYAFHLDGRIIGYLGTLTAHFWDGNSQHAGHWMKGFWVLDEFRNGPVGFKLLHYATEDLGLCGVMTVAPPSVRLFGALGFEDRGVIANQVSVLRPGRFLTSVRTQDLASAGVGKNTLRAFRVARSTGLLRLVGGLLEGTSAVTRWGSRNRGLTLASEALEDLMSEEVDHLWHEMKEDVSASIVRDASYLRSRFGDASRYAVLTARDGGQLVGIAVLRRPSAEVGGFLPGIRVAVLADLVVRPGDLRTIRSLVAGARREASDLGADLLVASVSHGATLKLLRPPHFVTRLGNVHLMIRDAAQTGAFSDDLSDWWSMRGDAGSDEGL